jgi:hypothetical protein
MNSKDVIVTSFEILLWYLPERNEEHYESPQGVCGKKQHGDRGSTLRSVSVL